MTRIANLAQHERNLSYILDAQKRLNLAQLQVASGRKAENYSGIARDARRLVNVESAHRRTTQYVENNKLIDQRLQTVETNISQVFDRLTEYKTLLVNALNANNSADLALPTQAQALLDEITALLNVQADGRYLFAGTRTDTEPVDQSKLPTSYTIPSADGDASAYYQGDSTRLSVRADDNFTISYGVTADETGFEQAIRSLHLVIVGPPNDRATMEEGLRVVSQAIDSVSNIRTRVGAARAALGNVNQRHDDFLLFSEKTISDIENVDVTRVMTEMNSDQLAVEASFMTLARLSNLTLTRFLR